MGTFLTSQYINLTRRVVSIKLLNIYETIQNKVQKKQHKKWNNGGDRVEKNTKEKCKKR